MWNKLNDAICLADKKQQEKYDALIKKQWELEKEMRSYHTKMLDLKREEYIKLISTDEWMKKLLSEILINYENKEKQREMFKTILNDYFFYKWYNKSHAIMSKFFSLL